MGTSLWLYWEGREKLLIHPAGGVEDRDLDHPWWRFITWNVLWLSETVWWQPIRRPTSIICWIELIRNRNRTDGCSKSVWCYRRRALIAIADRILTSSGRTPASNAVAFGTTINSILSATSVRPLTANDAITARKRCLSASSIPASASNARLLTDPRDPTILYRCYQQSFGGVQPTNASVKHAVAESGKQWRL